MNISINEHCLNSETSEKRKQPRNTVGLNQILGIPFYIRSPIVIFFIVIFS